LTQGECEAVENWLRTFVGAFRSLPEVVQWPQDQPFGSDIDYRPPLQIKVFWLRKPEFQIILRSHFQEWGDLEVGVRDADSFEALVQSIDQGLREPKWQRPLTPVERPYFAADFDMGSLSDAVTGALVHWIGAIEFTRPELQFEPPRLYSFSGVVQSLSVEVFVGNLADQDSVRLLAEIGTRLSRELSEPTAGVSKGSGGTVDAVSARGYNSIMAHFYPSALFGERLKPSGFAEARARTYKARLNESLRTVTLGRTQVVVHRNGLLLARTTDYKVAHRIFETIFASAALLGLPFHSMRYAELAEARTDPQEGKVNAWSYPLETLRTRQIQELWNPWNVPLSTRPVVLLETLDEILKLAGIIYSQSVARRDCIILSEASTSFREGDHLQTFVWSWTLLERILSREWSAHLLGQNPPADKGRKDVAGDSSRWTIGTVLRGLRASGRLSGEDYQCLTRWQSKRNGIIHRGEVVTQEEAGRLLLFVTARVRASIGLPPGPQVG
jgi:hypothetical protein